MLMIYNWSSSLSEQIHFNFILSYFFFRLSQLSFIHTYLSLESINLVLLEKPQLFRILAFLYLVSLIL